MEINVLAVAIAAIVSFIIGWLWYSDLVFGKIWRREMGITDAQTAEAQTRGIRGMRMQIALGFLGTLVMAFVLKNVIITTGASTVSAALILGAWLWAGFVATVMLGSVIWEHRSWKLYGINVLYQLIAISVMAVILGFWV